MDWIALSCAGAFAVLLTSCATSERQNTTSNSGVQTIALDQIWAYGMPGTHAVQELEPDKFGEHTRALPSAVQSRLLDESMADQSRVALRKEQPSKGGMAKPGFAVLGTGAEALQGAYHVLVKGHKPVDSFPMVSNVTLVFYSHLFGDYVHLEKAERRGKTIEVRYRFVPHYSKDMAWEIALIPLGKLPVGTYDVKIIQLPLPEGRTGSNGRYVSDETVSRIICRPFSFSIADRSSIEPQ
jgi:hypothetical protein